MTQQEQYERMTRTPVHHLICSLAVPTIISMLVTNIYNMADTYFVSGLGTSASAATGVVFGLMAILQAFGFMFGHGAGSHISRRLGARDVNSARTYSTMSFYLSLAAGAVIAVLGIAFMDPSMRLLGSTDTILPYARDYAFYILIAGPAFTSSCVMNNILHYEGKAFYAMIGLTSGGILNIFGDAFLINVLHMGISGAGLSTAVSQYISMIILAVPFIWGQVQSSLSPRYFRFSWKTMGDIVYVGFPSLMRQGLDGSAPFDAVRQRAGMPVRPLTEENLLAERLMELHWEGWRRQDMVRFGRFHRAYDLRNPLSGEASGYTTVFPIPGSALELNRNLTQNDGYQERSK